MSLTHNRYEVLKSNKYPILITIGFFLVTTYVSFFHHDFWTIFDQDGLIYLSGGQQIIAGVGENVSLLNAGPAGPVLFASLESVLKDGLFLKQNYTINIQVVGDDENSWSPKRW